MEVFGETQVKAEDFAFEGDDEGFQWGIKFKGNIGPDDRDNREMRVFNRLVTWTCDGIELEADQRLIEALVSITRT